MNEFDEIIEQVSCLYKKFGVKSVTMDDVARELGISKKTLYAYVSSKEDLVEKFIDYDTKCRKSNMESILGKGENAIHELLEVNKQVVKMLKSYNPSTEYDLRKYYPQQYNKLRKVRMENMYTAIVENIERGIKEGVFRKDLKPEIIARVHVSRIENSFMSGSFSIEELTSEEFVHEMMIYHIRGIANGNGIEFLENKMLNS